MVDERAETESRPGFPAHLRRYGVFYGIAVVVILVLVLLPNIGGDEDDDDAGSGSASEVATDGPWQPGSGDIEHGSGTARSGVACEPGVGQIEDTVLTVPCLPEFTGDNGGETHRGVSEDTIRLAMMSFPETANSQAVDAEQEEAGLATDEDTAEIADQFFEYFNENYELYGRQVEIVEYEARFGDATEQALGQGREGACQDATMIAEELDVFGVFAAPASALSAVFAECAAERDLVVFAAAANYPESFFAELHPYVWSTTMDCEQMARHAAAYIGTRLVGQPAEFAGDPELASETRVFGSYTPDTEQYASCNDMSREILEEEYDAPLTQPVRYALDISRFAEQAERAVVQWKADGVTTVVMGADPISVGYLTQSAEAQDYHPEWIILGSAATDTNPFGRDYEQAQVDGHLFGLSQISSNDVLFGPESEPGRLYEKLNGEEILAGTTGDFFGLVHVFNLLQAAGPELTPDNLALGVSTLPAMGGEDRVTWFFGDGHTATKDAREVYWDGSAPPDPSEADQDAVGAYIETYDGRRFMPDEWPEEPPPIYPDR